MVAEALGTLMSQLTECLEGRSEVIVVYLYGSHAEGRANALSDVDIGVLVRDGLAKERLWDLEDSLSADLGRALCTDNLDLIVLNLAPLRIRYEVITRGEVLYSVGCVQNELDKTSEVSKVLYLAALKAIWDRVLLSGHLAEDFRSLTSTEIEHTLFS